MTTQERTDIALMNRGGNENNMFITLPQERRTEEVCRRAIELSVYNFRHVPEALRTEELCRRVVREWGGALSLVPEPLLTGQMCMEAVRNHGWALDYVPRKFCTPEICAAAVRNDAGALVYVPKERLTEKLCIASVRRHGPMLQFVPDDLRTKEVCRAALAGSGFGDFNSGEISRLIPYPDICLEGLKRFAPLISDMYRIFESIPDEALDERVALFGVKADPACLLLLPERVKTEEVCREAISREGVLIHAVPLALQTEKMCREAVLSNVKALQFIPTEQHTSELYRQALEANALSLLYFKPELLTHEMCERALEITPDIKILRCIPYADLHEKALDRCEGYMQAKYFLESMNPEYMTTKLAGMIFTKEPELFYNIPERFKDRELCETAVRYDGSYLRMVPEALKTPELCRVAIRRSPYAIQYLPDKMKTPEFYRELVRQNPRNLYGIPKNDRTYELCKIAFDNTYGRDKSDYSVAGALVEASMTLQMIREQDNPRMIGFLMDVMCRKAISEEVALEAVRKNGKVLHCVPQESITPQVAETAVENHPQAIQWVPREMRTADMCLRAECTDPSLKIYVPEHIAKEDNVYSFRAEADDLIRRPLGYDDYKRLYAGETAYVPDVQSPAGSMGPCRVYFDTQKRHFIVEQLDDTQQKKENRTVKTLHALFKQKRKAKQRHKF